MRTLAHGSSWLQSPNCNSLLILNKPIFVGEIAGSLFVLCQHFGGSRGQRRPLRALGLVSQKVWYHSWAHCAHCFSCQSWSLNVSLSPGSEIIPSLHLKLSRLYLGSILRFYAVWLRPFSVCECSFGTWVWFWCKRFQSKLADKLSAHSFRNRGCFTENAPVQLLDHSFGIGAVLWKLAKKPLIWLLWDHAVSLELTGIS